MQLGFGASMAEIVLDGVTKRFADGTIAVDTFDLAIGDGELMVLVGPSGCGKSTVLRMVAGLETVTKGIISVGERVANDLSPGDRDLAMVFQDYALYPT
jgi:multiple sugar transport system ATP-binding protein